MCLAVPGKIIEIKEGGAEKTATVDFQGSTVDVSLSFTPDAGQGDYVLVHAGYAINQIDEEEAKEVWEYLKEIEEGLPDDPSKEIPE
jgi:hydrogenase expression/formation protein HypC